MKSKTKILKRPDKLFKQLKQLHADLSKEHSLKVGLPKGSNNYPDGTSVVMVGAIHEFGSLSKSIPERSFLRSTLYAKRPDYKKLYSKLAIKMVKGRGTFTMVDALGILGTKVQGDIQKKIVAISFPANAESTTKAKGSSNPLIDTGHLRQSITYVVES